MSVFPGMCDVLWFHLKSCFNAVEGMTGGRRGERSSFSSS